MSHWPEVLERDVPGVTQICSMTSHELQLSPHSAFSVCHPHRGLHQPGIGSSRLHSALSRPTQAALCQAWCCAFLLLRLAAEQAWESTSELEPIIIQMGPGVVISS